jgi:hypothetical protein
MSKKQYPPVYEKLIPIALAVIGLLVVVLLVWVGITIFTQ